MRSRQFILVLCVLLGVVVLCWYQWRGMAARQQEGEAPGVIVEKQPVNFVRRTFDPASPPSDMPPFSPGEEAVCDSNFLSNVSVGGRAEKSDDTDEMATIRQVKVTLQLNITIWVPNGASQHVLEHEDGHRAISEFYYQDADKIAARIAASYMGKRELVSGADLNAEFNKWLQQEGGEIADEYGKELNPDPTQQRYDIITDYSRNDVTAKDAVAQVLKDVSGAPSAAVASPGN